MNGQNQRQTSETRHRHPWIHRRRRWGSTFIVDPYDENQRPWHRPGAFCHAREGPLRVKLRPRPAGAACPFYPSEADIVRRHAQVRSVPTSEVTNIGIHRQLRYDVPRTPPFSRQTKTKECVVQRDETVAGHFRTLLIVNRAFSALARRRFLQIHCVQAFLRRITQP